MELLPSSEQVPPSEQLPLFEEPVDEANKLPSPQADDSTSLLTANCNFCGRNVDPKSDTTYAEIRAWIHGAKKDSAVLRQYTGLYADSDCISLLRSGHHPLQKTLDEVAREPAVTNRITDALATDRTPKWLEGFADGISGRGLTAASPDGHDEQFEDYLDGFAEGEQHKEFGRSKITVVESNTF